MASKSKQAMNETVQRWINAVPCPAALLGAGAEILVINGEWQEMVSRKPAGLECFAAVGEKIIDTFSAQAHKGNAGATLMLKGLSGVMSGKTERHRQELSQIHDGSIAWFAVTLTRIDEQSSLLVLTDITPLKKAESRTVESESRYRNLVNQLPGITYIAEAGPEGNWFFVSPQVKTLLGFSEQEWISNRNLWFERIHPEDRERVAIEETRAAAAREHCILEYRIMTRDGRMLWFHDEALPLNTAKNDPTVFQGVMLDITERKKAEDDIRRKEEQLLRSQKMDALGRVAGGIAHDFNNLLTSIIGSTQFLLDGLPPGNPLRVDAQQVIDLSERGARLTRQLLSLGRTPMGRKSHMDVNKTIGDMERFLKQTLGEDILLTVLLSAEPAVIDADMDLFHQVIMNLSLNARDAMPQGGSLSIKTAMAENPHVALPPGGYVIITVKDNGCGMSEDVLRRIFEPFYTTKDLTKGSGLGLASVYSIVQQHRGHIDVDSVPNLGTEFRIFLPRVEGRAAEVAARVERPTLTGTGERILLAEDDEALRRLTVRILQGLGYGVMSAEDGQAALAVYEKEGGKFDMVLTDVVMPNLSGPELIEELKQRGFDKPYLFVSGFVDERVSGHGLAPSAANLLRKPFTRESLAAAVRKALGKV